MVGVLVAIFSATDPFQVVTKTQVATKTHCWNIDALVFCDINGPPESETGGHLKGRGWPWVII